MPHKGKWLAAGLAALAGVVAYPASTARADSTAPLTQLSAFHQILVDDPAGYVFLSEGQGSAEFLNNATYAGPGIVVTDLSGNYVTTLDAGTGAEGLALSSDGGTLYAALGPENAVAVISVSSVTPATTTPAQTYLPLNGTETPYSLAIQSGKLWVGYNPSPASVPGLSSVGSFDLSQADPSFDDGLTGAFGLWWSAPDLAADPAGSGVLIASTREDDPASLESYNVAGNQISVLASNRNPYANVSVNCDNESDLAIVPGGGEFIPACGWPYSHYYYSTKDFSALGDYPTGTYPNAVAVASGTGLVAAGTDSVYDPDIYIYEPGGSAPVNVYDFGYVTGATQTLANAGLALAPDGSELYAVTTDGSGYTLHVLDHPGQPKTSMTLTGPSAAIAGPLTLHGSLTLASGPAPAGETVSLTRTSAGGTVTLPSVTTGADGTFAVPDSPSAAGSYTYTASFAGWSGEVIASSSFTVTVAADTTTLTLTGPGSAKRSVALTGTLSFDGSPAPAGVTITVSRSVQGIQGAAAPLPSVTTGSGGTFTVTDKPGFTATFVYTVSYPGDPSHGVATASATVTVTAK